MTTEVPERGGGGGYQFHFPDQIGHFWVTLVTRKWPIVRNALIIISWDNVFFPVPVIQIPFSHWKNKTRQIPVPTSPLQAPRLTMAIIYRNVILVTRSQSVWSWKLGRGRTGFEIGRWLLYAQTRRFLVFNSKNHVASTYFKGTLCVYYSLGQNLVTVLKLILNLLN